MFYLRMMNSSILNKIKLGEKKTLLSLCRDQITYFVLKDLTFLNPNF